ncbi:MAG TPA: hypothetical protein VFJ28_10565 [Marmoricola sp.]|nr:hypothetical protein [Marmoricola sp.]
MKFIIETNLASNPAWWLVDDDEHVMAWAGRTFASLAYADQAAHDFRVSAEDPDYRVNTRSGRDWQWAAWDPEGVRVAVSGDWFPSEEAARDAARRVQQQACTAIGP